MHLGLADKERIAGSFTVIKEPPGPDVPGQQDPAVVARVSAMLSDIEKGGLEAVRRYAEELDGFSGDSFEVTPNQVEAAVANLPADLREALDAGASGPSVRRHAAQSGSPISRRRSSPVSSAGRGTSRSRPWVPTSRPADSPSSPARS